MRKCKICLVGTWAVGLSALAWGAVAVGGTAIELSLFYRILAAGAGIFGLGFLAYQPPLQACPRCVKANL